MSKQDYASVQKRIQTQKSHQTVSPRGIIQISKKGWVCRLIILGFACLAVSYSIKLGIDLEEPALLYVSLLPIHGILYLIIGWFFYRNPATGKAGNELVSIIIPVYNQESMIEHVIDAIYQSTYQNFEIIAVNDGSKDKSGDILTKLTKKYPKLKVIHRKNEGKRKAVATAFYNSRGKFIILVDSDSIIDKHAITEIMKTFNGDPRVGAVVANAKAWNARKNILTKCQDAWYDYSFNVRKAAETVFGSVFCCSGCLSGYRRKAIEDYIPYWVRSTIHNSEDRELTSYTFANSWAKKEFSKYYSHLPSFTQKTLESMASYDDAEDRSLTAQSLRSWKTVYAASATVYTDVPEKLRGFLLQQQRWKKGTTRVNFFVSSFFWQRNPLISLIFYIEFMLTFITPAIIVTAFVYIPIVHQTLFEPLIYLTAMLLTGFAHGLDYKFRDPKTKDWIYKPVMNLITAFLTSWLIFPALWNYRKNQWLTR